MLTPVVFGLMRKAAWLFPTKFKKCFNFRFLNINKFLNLYANKEGTQLSYIKYNVLPLGT